MISPRRIKESLTIKAFISDQVRAGCPGQGVIKNGVQLKQGSSWRAALYGLPDLNWLITLHIALTSADSCSCTISHPLRADHCLFSAWPAPQSKSCHHCTLLPLPALPFIRPVLSSTTHRRVLVHSLSSCQEIDVLTLRSLVLTFPILCNFYESNTNNWSAHYSAVWGQFSVLAIMIIILFLTAVIHCIYGME